MAEKNITTLTIILSIVFYVTSLTQEAYCTNGCTSAFMVLLAGILGVFTEIGIIASFIMDKFNNHANSINSEFGATFTWLANPIIVISLLIFRNHRKTALTLSIISTVLILSFMAFDKVIDSEAGSYSKITELKLGYWLWLFSSLTILIGSAVIALLKKSNQKEQNTQ